MVVEGQSNEPSMDRQEGDNLSYLCLREGKTKKRHTISSILTSSFFRQNVNVHLFDRDSLLDPRILVSIVPCVTTMCRWLTAEIL